MLSHLSIRDYLLVERVDLDFAPGLTVLTGETGAGKSILIDALALALGERAEGSVVRGRAARAEISAEFLIENFPDLHTWLDDAGIEHEDNALILRRTIDANGRSRGFINGSPATLAQLKLAAEFLLDIHGQHAYHALLRRPVQRQILDGFAGAEGLLAEVGAAWQAWQAAVQRRLHAETHGRERQIELDGLNAAVDALLQLGDDVSRWDDMQIEHARLAHVTHLTEGSQALVNGLDEDEASVQVQLNAMSARIAQMAEFDVELRELVQLMNAASANVDEAVHGLRRYADKLSPDPARLAELDRRMSEMHQLARKHHTSPEALHELRDALQQRLLTLETEDDIEAMQQAERAAWAVYEQLAAALSVLRRRAALELSASVTAAIQELALKDSVFHIVFLPVTEARAHGLEDVEFQVAAQAGLPSGALAKVASGGELSRIGLAIQTALSGVAGVSTLIFDEVDVGIGGAVAESVGRRLERLGQARQVLVITHLPQVAARGSQHLRVAKLGRGEQLMSQIEVLDPAARVEEIARMLGGLKITATTRQHAAEMLAAG
jgi:DNA repair protein RecN (Recombination protein N)